MPVDISNLGGYTYPPPPPQQQQTSQPYYSLDSGPSGQRARASSFTSATASQSHNGYADYSQMLTPSTPTDRYNTYGSVIGMPSAQQGVAGINSNGPRIEDRRHSLGGAGLTMHIDPNHRRASDVPHLGSSGVSGTASNGLTDGLGRDEDDDRGKKKKRRHAPDQFVCRTCGRTDSPEWRKGPDGPKTLCNACGLRWAKQVRKGDDGGKAGMDGDGGE